MEKEKQVLIYSIIAIVLMAATVIFFKFYVSDSQPSVNFSQNFCPDEKCANQGHACGWFNSSVQCIKFPCAQDFDSACAACNNPSVAYWTEGDCPKQAA